MQCPRCGCTNLLPWFKYCPECTFPLPRASSIPNVVDVEHKTNEDQSIADNRSVSGGGKVFSSSL